MHVIIEFGDLVGWILFGIIVVVTLITVAVATAKVKFREWKKKRQDKKGDKQDAGKQ